MQWEYLVGFNSGADEAWLNELGVKGWELVSVGPMLKTWIFKRPKVTESGVSPIHPPMLTCCHCGEPIAAEDLDWERGGKEWKPRHGGCVGSLPVCFNCKKPIAGVVAYQGSATAGSRAHPIHPGCEVRIERAADGGI